MLSKLARQLGMVLLAISLVTSPVLGAMPRCCQTGAIAGGGNCCCGPREEAEDELPSCCQHAQKSCCAEAAESEAVTADTANTPVANAAPCSCKTIGQMPALATAKDKVETHEKHLYVVAASVLGAATSRLSVSQIGEHHQAEPPGLSLHKVHCRWTI